MGAGQPAQMHDHECGYHTISISEGVPVATVYRVNNFDIPRIQSVDVPETQAGSHESVQQNSLDEANTGQLLPSEKQALVEVLKEYHDVFAANPEAVAASRGPPMRLKLKGPRRPHTPLYSPAKSTP